MASISGLVSGLDTSTIVSQLMQVEALGQTSLKTRLSTAESSLSSLQDLNAKIAAIATKAEQLAKGTAWSPVTITSSSELATVTSSSTTDGSTAASGSFSFTVGQRAQAHQVAFGQTTALTDVVTGDSTRIRLTAADGSATDLETGDGTLQGLVNALNGSGTGLRASTIRLDDGTHRLRVTAADTGEDAAFSLAQADGSDLLGGATVVAAGRDASITIGADTLTSATNTFTDVVPGTTITLQSGIATGTVVDVEVAADNESMTASVKDLVDQVNAALTSIDALTAYNSTTKTSGALAGDAAVRSLRNSLLSAIYPEDGSSMASAGIQLDRYGKLTFDEEVFEAAYAEDPTAVSAAFISGATAAEHGFAARIHAISDGASDSVSGSLTLSVQSRTDGIDRLEKSIDDWDVRLELRKATLTRQYTALETALNSLQSQSSWLSSQLSALSTSSSS